MDKKSVAGLTAGMILCITGVILIAVRTSKLFLPSKEEMTATVIMPSCVILTGIVLIFVSILIPKIVKINEKKKLRFHADSYGNGIYSYKTAVDALHARIKLWEKIGNTNDNIANITKLKTLITRTKDLEKMSVDFSRTFDELLNKTAIDAVDKIDKNNLMLLSEFINYCANVTDFEMTNRYFQNTCDNVCNKIKAALELYASIRTVLSSFNGDEKDYDSLREEVNQYLNNK
jgi:hypothetical protein